MSGLSSTGNRSPDAIFHNGIIAPRVAAVSRSRAKAGLPVRAAQPLRAAPPASTIETPCRQSGHSSPAVSRFKPVHLRSRHQGRGTSHPVAASAAVTKIPHARGLRLGNGTNLYDGISQPERYQVRSPISAGTVSAPRISRYVGGWASRRFQYRSFRYFAVGQVPPQPNQQFARESDDRDPPRPPTFVTDTLAEPATQHAFGLSGRPGAAGRGWVAGYRAGALREWLPPCAVARNACHGGRGRRAIRCVLPKRSRHNPGYMAHHGDARDRVHGLPRGQRFCPRSLDRPNRAADEPRSRI
jgi:hypothetical protein